MADVPPYALYDRIFIALTMAWFDRLQKRVLTSVESNEELQKACEGFFNDAILESQVLNLAASEIKNVPEVFHLHADPDSKWWELSEEERTKPVPEYLDNIWTDCYSAGFLSFDSEYITMVLLALLSKRFISCQYTLQLRARTPLTLKNWQYENRTAKIKGKIGWTVWCNQRAFPRRDPETGERVEDDSYKVESSVTLADDPPTEETSRSSRLQSLWVAASLREWHFFRIDSDSTYSHKCYRTSIDLMDKDAFRKFDRLLNEVTSTNSPGLKKEVTDDEGDLVNIPIDEAGDLYWH
ncbi:hypothetical protein BO94DRAFT_590392 [Aspergillus sclerotioniger CBS 115572]|uniref:Uncharacterized protein n=1 Tax=Aspergillus sclerotioniger CBS 115572 TaxID=1450535 RepID=A0A317V9D3_9EURO|nr:hypothetical protein BO94DRAFT_590392 [Aspergillus sclerotioniger CBS 115572]PWY69607.1 hypothetical protein BO94DRAFT_590392 [Aspergillus sclerotioniger CBS 115572]